MIDLTKHNINSVFEHTRETLTKEGLTVSEYKLIEYGLQFSIQYNNWSDIIRIYQNKKGEIKIDYSQIKDKNKAAKIRRLLESKGVIPEQQTKNNLNLGYPIIGTDESGKGDYFGPLVSSGVYVDENTVNSLRIAGVQDSKKLSDKNNIEIAKQIKNLCINKYSIIEISPEKYNNLYAQFKREKKNLNTLLAWGHAKAIEELLGKVTCNTAVADQFADEKFILSKLQEKGKQINLIQMPKAEQNIAVAAASILARARFLEKLEKLSNEFEISIPKGASQEVINTANIIVSKFGKDSLKKVAKLHFKTTNKVNY